MLQQISGLLRMDLTYLHTLTSFVIVYALYYEFSLRNVKFKTRLPNYKETFKSGFIKSSEEEGKFSLFPVRVFPRISALQAANCEFTIAQFFCYPALYENVGLIIIYSFSVKSQIFVLFLNYSIFSQRYTKRHCRSKLLTDGVEIEVPVFDS